MAYLRIFIGDTLLEQRELSAARTTIGRAADNDIVLQSSGVSKYHAVIERRGNAFVLIDNDSVNGVFIDGKRVKRHALKYWDEIQIFNYLLKFMAVARSKGEEAGAPNWSSRQPEQEATMELDISSLGDLTKLKKRINVPSVQRNDRDSSQKYSLDKVNFTIGKDRDCDIHVNGWLAPGTAAHIQRRNDGFYLLPNRRGRVKVNGRRIRGQTKLQDGDAIKVRGVALTFFYRPAEVA